MVVNMIRAVILLLGVAGTAVSQQFTIKFATIAPEGSSWMEVMREYDAAVRKESGGRLGFRIYHSGAQGDEKSVLRKIRVGQLDAGGFTGVGMGEIAPKVRILDAPFLSRTYEEVDHLYSLFDGEFRKAFEEGGFVLLGWAEVGFVHVFTNVPVSRPDDLKRLKMWSWEGDPVAEAIFRTLGITPIPVGFPDVMTSLQTGLIDAFYSPPYAAVALQWHTRAKYVVDVPLAISAGSVLISKRMYDRLPADLQEILLRNGRTYLAKLTAISRRDNREAYEQLGKAGLVVQKVDPKDVEHYIEVGRRARRFLVGKLYSAEFLDSVERAVEEFRKKNRAAQ
jgi:TRAP-type C4-dicarboxylate transport system substrate-binding protein